MKNKKRKIKIERLIAYIYLFIFLILILIISLFVINSLQISKINKQIDNMQEQNKLLQEQCYQNIQKDDLIQKKKIVVLVKSMEDDDQNRWDITLTKEERELLASIVMLEAGGEPNDGQQAVVEVIFNRIKSDNFPNTLYDVLSADGQFSTWKNRNISKAIPTDEVYENIDLVLAGETNILPFETVYFGKRPHNKDIEKIIDNHVFCNI